MSVLSLEFCQGEGLVLGVPHTGASGMVYLVHRGGAEVETGNKSQGENSPRQGNGS